MTKAPINVQDLRRRIGEKAKAEPTHRFWGLYVHVCKLETLHEAYRLAKRNNGAAGSDGIDFDEIEANGIESFLLTLRDELAGKTYRPLPLREVKIPKKGDKHATRTLKIPAIRDRVVQGALLLILEAIFERDFHDGSFGYRPLRSAHQALERVNKALNQRLHQVINLDLKSYFDTVRHHLLLDKIAKRVKDDEIMWLCKSILKSCGKIGLPQGSLIGPLFSNLYLNEVDAMLERAQLVTRQGRFEVVSYTRFADDLVVLVSGIPGNRHWVNKVEKRLREELNKLDLTINEDKSDTIDFGAGVPFDFLGYTFRWVPSRKDPKKNMVLSHPQKEKRTRFLAEISMLLRRSLSIPVEHAIKGKLNPRLRGWVNYFRWGNSGYDLSFVKWQIDMKVRKFATRQRPKRKGGRTWTNWSNKDLYDRWGLFSDYRVSWCREPKVHAT
jgi:RNA-directed DNA polymerase